jgi:S-adenosylmethionine:tRNA ribosyltransferase-isomerase
LPDNLGLDLSDVDSYHYDLPNELIAQNPAHRRDGARLMRVSRASGAGGDPSIAHAFFSELPELLRAGDLLVLNDTKVLRAKMSGKKIPGGAAAEIFCLAPSGFDETVWRALVRPGRKLPPGAKVEMSGGVIATVEERLDDGLRLVRFPGDISTNELFERCGQVPLPPYIKTSSAPEERYQTVYAKSDHDRSVAAPTAGLHFTDELFGRLEASGIERDFITLDVGLGTFRPVKTKDVREHRMHGERCRVEEKTAGRINAARRSGRRIVAVGTTVVRTLESMANDSGEIAPGEIETRAFFRPGYRFKAIDALVTNFHLPRSTLLMLVAAFAGHSTIMQAYSEAIRLRYRFFSFGDAMLIE